MLSDTVRLCETLDVRSTRDDTRMRSSAVIALCKKTF